MTRTLTLRATLGVLIRGEIKQKVERYCMDHDLACEIKESKGWFESYFVFIIKGTTDKLLPLKRWWEGLKEECSD